MWETFKQAALQAKRCLFLGGRYAMKNSAFAGLSGWARPLPPCSHSTAFHQRPVSCSTHPRNSCTSMPQSAALPLRKKQHGRVYSPAPQTRPPPIW
ncbi:hypothetical protein SE16_00645 [Ardenticatena maritima]|uniref:Uncharacterized protein n=1 Tax=Ardenticatena maritima TaxID=872965 RepID=A0A0P6YFL1_9CHLR|nr:hypothetical protein SE16_00645 [Ardenticatena maritima]